MLTTDSRGRWAEEQAKNLLEAKGYRIVRQRYKCRYGEIDLIVEREGALIAVEVKYRQYYSDAAESVSLRQRKRITKALGYFLAEQEQIIPKYSFIRFDVVLLCQAHKPIHIINAWQSQDELHEF
jgi:putative endonuclease